MSLTKIKEFQKELWGQEVRTAVAHFPAPIKKEDRRRPNNPERTEPFTWIVKEIQRKRNKPLPNRCLHARIAERHGLQPRASPSASFPDVDENRLAFLLRGLECFRKVPSPGKHLPTSR